MGAAVAEPQILQLPDENWLAPLAAELAGRVTPDAEEQTWLALTSVMMRLPAALDAQLRRDAGIGHFDYVVMSALSMSEGRTMRLSDLGGLVDASLSRLSHTFNRLERSGWVRPVSAEK